MLHPIAEYDSVCPASLLCLPCFPIRLPLITLYVPLQPWDSYCDCDETENVVNKTNNKGCAACKLQTPITAHSCHVQFHRPVRPFVFTHSLAGKCEPKDDTPSNCRVRLRP